MNKIEYRLHGLNCANCSAKIHREVEALTKQPVELNFLSKTLTLTNMAEGTDWEEAITAIAKKHEPQIEVRRLGGPSRKETLLLDGLGCANCARKIQDQVGSLPGITLASVDFVSKRLTLELTPEGDPRTLEAAVQRIATAIEPEVQVRRAAPGSRAQARLEDGRILAEARKRQRQELQRLGIGGGVFLLALFLPLTDALELLFFVLSYLIVGGSVLRRAWTGMLQGQVFSEHFLMSIATLGAFAIGEYPEGVAVMLFYLVGEIAQNRAVDHSRNSISALMDIRPDYANLLDGETPHRVDPEAVQVGDRILIRPGERIPLDGTVLLGTSTADTSALTGESLPRDLAPGSTALSGFINQSGLLTLEVTRSFGESTVSKILDLVQNASSKKAPTENFIAKFARYYTPAVVFTAMAVAVLPPLLVEGALFSDWFYRALVFLVVSCPCALVISIPLGFFGGIGGASKRGILVKGGNFLEALNSVDTVVFDKTGTLTQGIFEVRRVLPAPGHDAASLLRYAAHAEHHSTHPIGQSIVKAYGAARETALLGAVEEFAGTGVRVAFDGRTLLAGNQALLKRHGIKVPSMDLAGTLVHVAVDQDYAGSLLVGDALKEDAAAAVAALRKSGVKHIAMLTGDRRSVADAIGRSLGLDQVFSELLPKDKVHRLEALQRALPSGRRLAYVGDGINDAPVLARADIGFAMGGLGSDAAIEAADIVIMDDAPLKVATALKVARRTRTIVYQNIAFALGVKGIFLLLGAMGLATMWEAVFADVGVALLAVLNALRVLNAKAL